MVAGAGRFVLPYGSTIVGVIATVGVAPVGAALVVDVNRNGVTLFTTQGSRPQIPDGQLVSAIAVPDITAVAANSRLSVDVDQVGSGTPGSDLTVEILYTVP